MLGVHSGQAALTWVTATQGQGGVSLPANRNQPSCLGVFLGGTQREGFEASPPPLEWLRTAQGAWLQLVKPSGGSRVLSLLPFLCSPGLDHRDAHTSFPFYRLEGTHDLCCICFGPQHSRETAAPFALCCHSVAPSHKFWP